MKRVLSIIAGVVTGFLVIFIGDATGHAIHPAPLGLNYMDKSVMLDYISKIPRYVLAVLTFFWLLSAFCGGLITALVAKANWRSAVMSTAGILLAATLLNLFMTSPAHPVWMWIIAIAGYFPCALLGGWLVKRGRKKTEVTG